MNEFEELIRQREELQENEQFYTNEIEHEQSTYQEIETKVEQAE